MLTVVTDSDLCAHAARVIAAAGLRMSRVDVPTRRGWLAAAAVILDEAGATLCASSGLPRRDGVLLVAGGVAATPLWTAAVAAGAQGVCVLPVEESELLRHLAEAVESASDSVRPGRVIGVTPGRGGAGASIFSAALAHCAGEALLIDVDPFAGGIDLLLGPHLAPCPTEGGISEIDAALRNEVRAVYALDDAAMAVAGMQALGAEIEAALTEHAAREQVEEPERVFSTADAAELFGKSRGWTARGVRAGRFE